ncbi:hypothetical protein M1437_00500 [Patescibacteria group bacterium]|nr:hypothetical protein [Patescibacteria group bacterium]
MTVRKLVISFSLLVISLFVIPLSALAISSNGPVASPSAATNYELRTTSSQLPATVSPTSPLYTDLLVNNIFHTFSCLAVGQSVIGQPCLTYQVTKNAQGMIQGVPVLSQVNLSGGTLGAVTGVIGALYQNPPVRTADYLASMGKDLGLVKEAHAQVVGSGQDVLHPILSLWQASRNIAYVLMIIIFLIIGLMVMFRNRINPQTVITAQAALPGLVVGLIMITFSYFFAGLVADTAFIGTNIVGYYFSTAHNPPLNPPQNLLEDIKNKNVLSIFSPLTRVMRVPDVISAINSVWDDLADPTIGPLDILNTDPQRVLRSLTTLIATQFALPFGGLFGGIGQIVIGAISVAVTQAFPVQIAGFALAFVAMAALIYAMFKLLLRLINSYLTIVFLTITAPFQLLAAALPGRQRLATGWILNMLANVLAFPAVLAVLYFVAFIVGS